MLEFLKFELLKRSIRKIYLDFCAPPLARKVIERRLTYLTLERFVQINKVLRSIKKEAIEGDFLEFGVALGGSGIFIAAELDGERCFHGYDVFTMIPEPGVEDENEAERRYNVIKSGLSEGIQGELYYGYIDNLYEKVLNSFREFGHPVDFEKIWLHNGCFENTINFTRDHRIAFAHIDCDWYEPVRFCLEKIRTNVSPGGFVIVDDYNDYAGCKKATNKFLISHSNFRLVTSYPTAVLRRA